MYDNSCKFLAENFSTDFASWLLGEPIPLTKIKPSELSVEPIRADSVMFMKSSKVIVHIEFQTKTDKDMALRMLDYWVRLHKKYPNKKIHQTVIYLKRRKSPLVFETSFVRGETIHNFNVIRLWEQQPEIFTQYVGLLPFAVLAKTNNPTETLEEVGNLIDNISDGKVKSDVVGVTAIIAGLLLNIETIHRILGREIVEESVVYQEALLKGDARGEARGIAKGEARGEAREKIKIALNMLHSNISIELIAQFTGLSVEEIEKLRK